MNTTQHNKTPTYISRILTIGSAVCSFALFRMLLNSKSEWSDLFGWASETVCCIRCMQDKKSTRIHNITSNKTYVLASRKHCYLLLFFFFHFYFTSFIHFLSFLHQPKWGYFDVCSACIRWSLYWYDLFLWDLCAETYLYVVWSFQY